MIVDDDAEMRALLAEYFRRLGFDVAEKESGAAALQAVATDRFDCFILDVAMPEMSGIELAHSLARTNEDMRLVVMSGHPPTEMALPNLRRPAAFLAKPFTPSELRQQMYAVLADVTDQQP